MEKRLSIKGVLVRRSTRDEPPRNPDPIGYADCGDTTIGMCFKTSSGLSLSAVWDRIPVPNADSPEHIAGYSYGPLRNRCMQAEF